jgi:PAS domain S-box-containing protein
VPADTARLRRLAGRLPMLGGLLDTLAPLLAAKRAVQDSVVALADAGRAGAARELVARGVTRELMDRIRAGVEGAVAELQAAAAAADRAVDVAGRRTRRVVAVAEVTALAVLALAGLAIGRQLAARTRAEAALRARESELQQVIDGVPVGIMVFDRAGRTRYMNRRAPEILGGTGDRPDLARVPEVFQVVEAATGRPFPAERLPAARALAGETCHADDLAVCSPGRPVPVEVWAAPVRDEQGRVALAVTAFADISARVRAEQEIAALNAELSRRVAELEELNRELETFSYSVSHDLRAPVRAMDGFARMVLEDHGAALPEEGRRRLAVIRERSQHLGRLIDGLLRLSRVGRCPLAPEAVDMEAAVTEALTDLDPVDLSRVELDRGPLPGAPADPTLVRQVWTNLLANAVKYSRPAAAPRILIRGEIRGAEAVYSIADNGVGLDPAHAGRLFGVFQRLHRPEEFEGTGIGLALVQRVVQRHGGTVGAEGAPGAGARFWFTLPLEA